ncbi:MAG: hypothetical protein J6T57_01670 [Alphaproteobacteria bacterium]|nr:hypothetical protein [Alphaproteobacteria bacterium]
MTEQDLLNTLNERGAIFAPPSTAGQINLTNMNLQKIRAAIIPSFLSNLYQKCGGINLGSGYIFGPNEVNRGTKYPIPNILQINQDLTNIQTLRGKTVFGRNDLFWFTVNAFGKCTMVDNLNLGSLRQYDDPYRAIFECLVGGKI